MPKEYVCAKCGDTVSKRKSRLVGNDRICKEHEEAKEFAEKDQAAFIEKMNSARQVMVRKTERSRRIDPTAIGSSLRQLAAYAVLGQLWRERQEAQAAKEDMAKEMLICGFKSCAFKLFFNTLNEHTGSTDEKKVTIQKAFDEFESDLKSSVGDYLTSVKVSSYWKEATFEFIDNVFTRLEQTTGIAEECSKLIVEWEAYDKRHDELYDILHLGEREKQLKHHEMLEEQAELMSEEE